MFADRQTAAADRDSSLAGGIRCSAAQIAVRAQPCSEKSYTGTGGILLLILGGFYRLPRAAVRNLAAEEKAPFSQVSRSQLLRPTVPPAGSPPGRH